MECSKARPHTLAILPLVMVPIAFLLSGSWLKGAFGSPVVIWVAAAAVIFVMGYANYLFPRRRK